MAALAVVATGTSATARSSNFPTRGIVVPGQSIAGVKIGMTEEQVAKLWGHNYEVCTSCGKKLVWLYEYRGAEPLGAAVKFDAPAPKGSTREDRRRAVGNLQGKVTPTSGSKVISVFTLGSPASWASPAR